MESKWHFEKFRKCQNEMITAVLGISEGATSAMSANLFKSGLEKSVSNFSGNIRTKRADNIVKHSRVMICRVVN